MESKPLLLLNYILSPDLIFWLGCYFSDNWHALARTTLTYSQGQMLTAFLPLRGAISPHSCNGTQRSNTWMLGIYVQTMAATLPIKQGTRMNVPARIHIEETSFSSTFLDTDALSLYETSFKLTINGGCVLHLMKRKLYHIRSSALWLRPWIRWGL